MEQTKDKESLSSFASDLLQRMQLSSSSSPSGNVAGVADSTTVNDGSSAVPIKKTQEHVDYDRFFNKGSSQDNSVSLPESRSPSMAVSLSAMDAGPLEGSQLTVKGNDLNSLSDSIQARLHSGGGEFIYCLKTDDTGNPLDFGLASDFEQAFAVLQKTALNLHAQVTLIAKRNDGLRTSYFVLIRQIPSGHAEDLIEIRVACVGNVDAGKSTLLGVLVTGDLDDGRGLARVSLFKHKHEIDTGRTSSVGMELMGFDVHGKQVVKGPNGRRLQWESIAGHAAKIVTFLDLAGHEKYLKTTVFGMTGFATDYVMLIVGSNAGAIGMTKEHLGLALALNVPVLVAITKVDMCPPNVLDATIKQLTKILKSSGCRKIPLFIRDVEDVVVTAQNFASERICPIFQISSVAGTGLDLLRQFINLLPIYHQYDSTKPVEYQITDTFSVPGVGTVVSGTLLGGSIQQGETLLLGPDEFGQFHPCTVKSIQRKRIGVVSTTAGQSSSLALKKIKRSSLRKGMVIVGKDCNPQATWEFDAEILILYHSSTIAKKYQAMIHCGNVRQSARILSIEPIANTTRVSPDPSEQQSKQSQTSDVIRTGDRAIVRFQFLQYPEYVKPGQRLLFREGRTKGMGKITAIYPDIEAHAPQ